MRKIILFISLAFLVMQASSENYKEYRAIFMDRQNLEKSVFYTETNRDLKNPGKIYHKYPYLFVNEKYKGIHVIDNTDPKKPVKKGFISAPGCLDIVVKNDIVYIDNSVDLVSFSLKENKVTKRIKNVFPEPAPPSGYYYGYYNRPDNYILIGWEHR